MKIDKYCGIIPAFYACYNRDGAISTMGVKGLARHLVNKGVKGLYINGSSGECIYLSVEERMAVLEAVVEEVRGECSVIAHVACNNTMDSCRLAAHAQSLGVDAIASIPPIYFRLPDHAVADYWNEISAAAPETDFIIYNIPQLAGVALTPALFASMRENPRVIGVKNSSMPTADIESFVRIGGENCIVFNGPDEQFVAGRVIGAKGGIGGTYAAMPELFLAMDGHLNAGRLQEALAVQHEVNGIIEQLCACRGNMYAVIKQVLHINEGLELGGVRKPLAGLVEEDLEKVDAVAGRIRQAIKTFS